MSAVVKVTAIVVLVALAFGIRRINQRWFAAVRATQPTKARALRVESRIADAILVVVVVFVSLVILAA